VKMAGLWTKQLTTDNRVFYYNAAQGRSTWDPPIDATVHVAPQLRAPTLMEMVQSDNNDGEGNSGSSSGRSSSSSDAPPSTVASTNVLPAMAPPPFIPLLAPTVNADDLVARALQKQQQQKQHQLQHAKKDAAAAAASNVTTVGESYLQQKAELEAAASGRNADGSKWHVR
jgi:WW domain